MEKDVLARIIAAEREIQECLDDQKSKADGWIDVVKREMEEEIEREEKKMKESLGDAMRNAHRRAEDEANSLIKAAEEEACRLEKLDDGVLKKAVLEQMHRIVSG